jgi:tetratricopeptide (TPR) repeat protein
MRVERYLLPALPMLLLIASIGITEALRYINRLASERGLLSSTSLRFIGIIVFVVIILIVSFVPIQQTLSYQATVSLPDTRTLAKQWLLENVAPHSTIAAGPFGINIPQERYTLFLIPFTPTGSENLFMFYQTKWFEDIDLLIASDYDYSRFEQDTLRYRYVLPYFDSLKANWTLLDEIKPGNAAQGPAFRFYVYQHPRLDTFPQETLQKLTTLADTNILVYFTERLASLLFFKGKLQKSRQLMQLAIVYDPTNTKLLRELTYTLYNLNDYEMALQYAERSLQLDPQQAEILALEGGSLLRLNRFDKAESPLRKALALNKSLEIPYLDLESLYNLRGDVQGQITVLTQYLTLFPKRSEKAEAIRERIKQLQKSL